MKPGWQTLPQQVLAKLNGDYGNDFGKNLKRFMDDVFQILTSGALIRDNQYAAIATFKNCQHGVMSTITNPLKTLPLLFLPFATTLADGSTALPLAGMPILTTTLGNGQIGMTPQFQPSSSGSGSQGEELSASVAQGSAAALTTGTALAIVTLPLTAGTWDVFGNGSFTTTSAPTGTRVMSSISLSNTSLGPERAQLPIMPVNGVADVQMTLFPLRVSLAASANVYQVSLSNFSAGNVKGYGTLSAVRAFPYLTGYTANVTGILWGG